MIEFVLLLLPAAAASGWYVARRADQSREVRRNRILSGEYIRGLNYLLSEQNDRALEVFINMADIDSTTVETHLILGNLFRRRGEVDRAIRIHQNLIDRTTLSREQRAGALLELGKDYLNAGVLDRAETLFMQLVEAKAFESEAYLHLRAIYEQERDWEKAIWAAGCRQAAAGEDQSIHVAHYYCEMGEAAMQRGDLVTAAQMAGRAQTVRQDFVRAGLLLGDVAAVRGEWDEAAARYAYALRQNADLSVLVLPRLREVYARLGDQTGYERLLRERLAVRPTAALIQELALMLVESRRFAELAAMVRHELAGECIPLPVIKMLAQAARNAPAGTNEADEALDAAILGVERHTEAGDAYRCTHCGFGSRGHFWRCPGCHRWGTLRSIAPQEDPDGGEGGLRA